MASFKGIRNAHAENKMLKYLGMFWKTEIAYDPTKNLILAENMPVGKSGRYQEPIVILGDLEKVYRLSEIEAWIAEKLAAWRESEAAKPEE